MRTIRQAQSDLRRMKTVIQRGLLDALNMTVSDGLQLARTYSSGNRSLAQLRAEDHPYATRHAGAAAIPHGDPGIINEQTGGFRQHWRSRRARVLFGVAAAQLRNDSPVADFLKDGTPTMIRRPIDQKLESVMAPDLQRKAQSRVNMVS